MVLLDEEFHALLFAATRNSKLSQIIGNLREQIARFRRSSLSTPGRIKAVFHEHKSIVEAISDRNSALAQALAKEHIENAEHSLMDWVKERRT